MPHPRLPFVLFDPPGIGAPCEVLAAGRAGGRPMSGTGSLCRKAPGGRASA